MSKNDKKAAEQLGQSPGDDTYLHREVTVKSFKTPEDEAAWIKSLTTFTGEQETEAQASHPIKASRKVDYE